MGPDADVARFEGDYDYVVVGGGSAGCVLANRLSADPGTRVLLLEAGGKDNWIWLHIPVGYLYAMGNPRADWLYKTRAEAGLNGRSLNYPRGKVLGGSSAINAMISMRGQAADYDHWRQLGLTGWGWDDVLPVFKRLDDHFLGDTEHHGRGGPWPVAQSRVHWEVLDKIAEAATQMGVPLTEDFNTGDNEGVGPVHVNQRNGVRVSAATAFLKPVRNRPNLRVETGVMTEKVLFEGKRATGVRFSMAGKMFDVSARREVILSAGSIGSTQILQLSGVGPGEWLQDLGIPVVLDRQGVGRNLQDHLQLRTLYKVSGIGTLNEAYWNLARRAWMGIEYGLFRRGPLTMTPSLLGLFTRTGPEHERANIQFHIQPLSLDAIGKPLHRFPGVSISACNLRPSSRGTIRITSRDVREQPELALNYLQTDDDKKVAADSLRVTRRLMAQPALQPYHPEPYKPGPDVGDTDAELVHAAGDIGTTIFHPVGVAKMGLPSDPMAVVDHNLRLIGLENLRVVDASVMPTIVSANTNTPTIMIAEKGAEAILSER